MHLTIFLSIFLMSLSLLIMQMRLKKTGVPALLEGEDVGDWVIVDAGDVIVHVFHPETRDLYRIEELWGGETPHRAK